MYRRHDADKVEQEPQLETRYTNNGFEAHELLFIIPQLAVERLSLCNGIRVGQMVITVEDRIDLLIAFRLKKLLLRALHYLLRLRSKGTMDHAQVHRRKPRFLSHLLEIIYLGLCA